MLKGYFIPASVSDKDFQRLQASDIVRMKGAVNAKPQYKTEGEGTFMFVEGTLPANLVSELGLEPPRDYDRIPDSWLVG